MFDRFAANLSSIALASVLLPVTAQVPPGSAQVLPRATLGVSLPVGRVPLLEHSPVVFPISLSVRPGVGGARPTHDIAVCPASGGACVLFPQVTAPWDSPPGSKLTVSAPSAGQAREIKLVACLATRSADSVVGCGRVLSDSVQRFDVKMRFAVHFDSFEVLHTRARAKDTTYYYLAGTSSGQSVPKAAQCAEKLGPFIESSIWCIGPSSAGDLSNGVHPLTRIRVGEFEWVPGRANSLTFAFATLNYGAKVAPLSGPVVDMRRLALDRGLHKLSAPHSGVLEDFTPELNDLSGWRGCDGPTAAGAKRIFNFRDQSQQEPTIDELTRSSGKFSSKSKVFVVSSQNGCGASSRYQVNWSISRTSWRSY